MMSYPNSPFSNDFNADTLFVLKNQMDDSRVDKIQIDKYLKWLCLAPEISIYKINNLLIATDKVINIMREQQPTLKIEPHAILPNVVMVSQMEKKRTKLNKFDKEVLIDSICGQAVMRGAHVYAPGVMGMCPSTKLGDIVSLFIDPIHKCKKGLKITHESSTKIHLANGVVKMSRNELFNTEKPTGIAVEIFETISNCPILDDRFLPNGSIFLQNLPSIICCHVLNPQPGETVLDMCACPGNKTINLAGLMRNQGRLIALDKVPRKIEKFKKRCEIFDIKAEIYCKDSTKISENDGFPQHFDRILLDAPCSALGKRPQFFTEIHEKVLDSYVPLQRKLLKKAVELLKIGGTLVYSTCTITLAENEGNIAWILDKFPGLELCQIDKSLCYGSPGLTGTTLTTEQREKLQRYGPDNVDSIGFFIAKFMKIAQ